MSSSVADTQSQLSVPLATSIWWSHFHWRSMTRAERRRTCQANYTVQYVSLCVSVYLCADLFFAVLSPVFSFYCQALFMRFTYLAKLIWNLQTETERNRNWNRWKTTSNNKIEFCIWVFRSLCLFFCFAVYQKLLIIIAGCINDAINYQHTYRNQWRILSFQKEIIILEFDFHFY